MKKFYLILFCVLLVFSACSKKSSQKEQKESKPEQVMKLEDTISRFYINILQDINKIEKSKPIAKVQNSIISQAEQTGVSTSNEESKKLESSPNPQPQDGQAKGQQQSEHAQQSGQQGQQQQGGQQSQGEKQENPYDKTVEKAYLSLKEIYEIWDQSRVQLTQDGVSAEDITMLDEKLNEMGYCINILDLKGALLSANECLFVAADILDSYGQAKNADITRLAYYVNSMDVQADDFNRVNDDIEQINKVLDSLEKSNAEGYKDKIISFRMAIESIKSATKYKDAQLIKLKSELLRDDVKTLKSITGGK